MSPPARVEVIGDALSESIPRRFSSQYWGKLALA